MTLRHQARYQLAACVVFALGACLTACNEDSNSNLGVQTPDEDRTELAGATGASSQAQPHTGGGATDSDATNGDEPSRATSNVTTFTEGTSTAGTTSEAAASSTKGQRSSREWDETSCPDASSDAGETGALEPGVVGSCISPISVNCGDQLHHDTAINGQPDEISVHACSARVMNGPEAVYVLEGAAGCEIVVRLTDQSGVLLLTGMQDCTSLSSEQCSSPTPEDFQVEQLSFIAEPAGPNLIIVDGYEELTGAYTLEVDCRCNLAVDAGGN
jgi:hypothetical protein